MDVRRRLDAVPVFTGWAEVLGRHPVLVPQTTMLGALIGLADMIQVFVLNMTYDFGLKQISFTCLMFFPPGARARRLANSSS